MRPSCGVSLPSRYGRNTITRYGNRIATLLELTELRTPAACGGATGHAAPMATRELMERFDMSRPMDQIDDSRTKPLQTEHHGQLSSGRSQSDVRLENCESPARRPLPNSLIASQRGPVTLLRLSSQPRHPQGHGNARVDYPALHFPTFHQVSAGAENAENIDALISGDQIMRSLITKVVLLVLLDSPVAIAQIIGSARTSAGPASPTASSSLTHDTRLIGNAPVGHRQPRARDIPSENTSDIEYISTEDAAVDRKLNICRGC